MSAEQIAQLMSRADKVAPLPEGLEWQNAVKALEHWGNSDEPTPRILEAIANKLLRQIAEDHSPIMLVYVLDHKNKIHVFPLPNPECIDISDPKTGERLGRAFGKEETSSVNLECVSHAVNRLLKNPPRGDDFIPNVVIVAVKPKDNSILQVGYLYRNNAEVILPEFSAIAYQLTGKR